MKAGDPLTGRLLILDALRMKFREVRLRRDPDCPVCGDHPVVVDLQDYEQFCGGQPAALPPGVDITAGELAEALRQSVPPLLLDVREPMEFQLNRLPGAVLIPLGDLPGNLADIDSTRDLVVYCHQGIRSARAVEFLRGAGFRARNLKGGIEAWSNEVDPAVPRLLRPATSTNGPPAPGRLEFLPPLP